MLLLHFYVFNSVRSGRFKLHILLYGSPISGSPFNLCFVAGAPTAMTAYVLSPSNPRKCYVSTARIIDLKKPIIINQESSWKNSNVNVKDYESVIKKFNINGKFYDNEIRIQLCDSESCPLTCGGHLVAAKGSAGTEVTFVADSETGIYVVKFLVFLPFQQEERKQFAPVLDITLNGISIYGFPIQMEPLNVNEIIEGYKIIEEFCGTLQGMPTDLLVLPDSGKAAAETFRKLSMNDEKYLADQLRELKEIAESIAADDENLLTKWISEVMQCKADAIKEPQELNIQFNKGVEKLQKKWLLMQKLRFELQYYIHNRC